MAQFCKTGAEQFESNASADRTRAVSSPICVLSCRLKGGGKLQSLETLQNLHKSTIGTVIYI